MNKTLVFVVMGIFLTIFSVSLVKRSSSETHSKSAMDFSTEVDENGDVTVGTTSPRAGSVGTFTTGSGGLYTGDAALGTTNTTRTFAPDPNNPDPTANTNNNAATFAAPGTRGSSPEGGPRTIEGSDASIDGNRK